MKYKVSNRTLSPKYSPTTNTAFKSDDTFQYSSMESTQWVSILVKIYDATNVSFLPSL